MSITLEGFLRYKPDLLNGIVLPPGLRQDILQSYIRRKSGMLFPWQQQPDQLKEDIGFWAQSQYQNWLMWQAAYMAEYDIRNDTEEKETYKEKYGLTWSDTGMEDSSGNDVVDGTRSGTGSSQNTSKSVTTNSANSEGSGNDSTDKKQPGYNQVGSPISVEQNVGNHSSEESSSSNSSDSFEGSGRSTSSESRKDVSTSHNNTESEHSGKKESDRSYEKKYERLYGGLAIMEKLRAAFRAREDLDVYEMIRAQFESEFLIQLY